MPIITIPAVTNCFTGYMIWSSSLSTELKIISTIIIVLKFVLFFYTALMLESGLKKFFGTISVLGFNLVLFIIALMNGVPSIAVIVGITITLLTIWYILTSLPYLLNRKD